VPDPAQSTPVARVLVVAPTPFFGDRGCHVRILEEVRALAALGVTCEIATYADGCDVAGIRLHRAARIPGVGARDLGPSYGRPILDAALAGTAWRAMRRFRPQVLHAHLHEGILIGALLRQASGVPLVADLQGSLTAELIDHRFLAEAGTAAAATRTLERWLVRRPDAILVSSAAGVAPLGAAGVSPDRIHSLPDGVDLTRFRPAPPDPALASQLGVAGKRVVVFLGVLTEYQGVDVLIDAVAGVVRVVPDAHFLVMGYPNEEKYRALVRSRGLEGAVTLTGRVPYDQASRYLTLGSVAVSAKRSLTEANGKLLNYMACGLPTVATDTTVNRELLGEAGVYVPIGDAARLAAAIAELLRAPERRAALGRALRARAETQFSWPALAARLAGVYERVAAGAGRPIYATQP
jgi:glycosyltransferase involved in cell wall biosynthesis